MIKVMLCDDMEEIREYFEWIVNSQDDMSVVATAQSGREAVETASRCKPDVILMDVQMEEIKDGIVATEKLNKMLPDVKVIMVTIHNDEKILIDSYVAGAVDYILKESAAEVVCDTIRRAFSNENFLGTTIAQKVKDRIKRSIEFEYSALFFINKMSNLTSAEWKILKHLYNGKKRKDIAKEETLSEETIKYHIRNMLKKLNFSSTDEMVNFLKTTGVIEKFNL